MIITVIFVRTTSSTIIAHILVTESLVNEMAAWIHENSDAIFFWLASMNNNRYVRTTYNERNIERVKKCKKLVITGSVGVGKTTTINMLKHSLTAKGIPYEVVPEYLDGDPNGARYLNEFLNHEMDAFSFEYYILTFFDSYLNNLEVEDNTLILLERLPDDVVICFANRMNKNKLMTDDNLYKLFKYCKDINERYGLPTYFKVNVDNSINYSILKSDSTAKVVESILKTKFENNFIVCLFNTNDECLQRIRRRGRAGEENYSMDDVNDFNNHYAKLYSMFISGRTLRYCDIGKLL